MNLLGIHISSLCRILMVAGCWALCLTSCDYDINDSESSEYQLLSADIVDVPIAKNGLAFQAIKDDDSRLYFSSPVAVSDYKDKEFIRCLLYYNKVNGESSIIDFVRGEQIPLLKPLTAKEAEEKEDKRDPLEILSSWRSANGKYLNIDLQTKDGADTYGSKKEHKLFVVMDSIHTSSTGRNIFYHIIHDQNGIPAYYSTTTYASIPLTDVSPNDTMTLKYNSWSGNKSVESTN